MILLLIFIIIFSRFFYQVFNEINVEHIKINLSRKESKIRLEKSQKLWKIYYFCYTYGNEI